MFDNNILNAAWIKPNKGRSVIKTSHSLAGNLDKEKEIIVEILKETLPIHQANVLEMNLLFSIFFNQQEIVDKTKETRTDINNKFGVASGYIVSRSINGYCFGNPIKYVSNDLEKQATVELFANCLETANNHNAHIDASFRSSICGLGYYLITPRKITPFDDTPWNITGDIDPTKAYVVYNRNIIKEAVMGVMISEEKVDLQTTTYYDVYTSTTQYRLKKDFTSGSEFTFIKNGLPLKDSLGNVIKNADGSFDREIGYPIMSGKIPLIELPRNTFRIGDWELAIDLFNAKNLLLSNRSDDIQQVVDYLLVLTNCKFEKEEDKTAALKSRLLQLQVKNPQVPPKAEILKTGIDQSAVQLFQDYIDSQIMAICGLPNREERSGGGQDTGKAVLYRNGFRDLENNAGLILPNAEKAEKEIMLVCLSICANNTPNQFANLKLRDIKATFIRTLTDDIVSSSQAYSTLINAGMDNLSALATTHVVPDPNETFQRSNAKKAEDLKVKIEEESRLADIEIKKAKASKVEGGTE